MANKRTSVITENVLRTRGIEVTEYTEEVSIGLEKWKQIKFLDSKRNLVIFILQLVERGEIHTLKKIGKCQELTH